MAKVNELLDFVASAFSIVLVLVVTSGVRAECLDYGAYVHQVGHVDTDEFGPLVAAVSGEYVYVVADSELTVVDVSNPGEPAIAGSMPGYFPADEVVVAGGYAYIGGSDGVAVADVSDPQHPRGVGATGPWGEAYGIAVRDTLLYVAEEEGFGVVDVSDPTHPQVAGSINLPGAAYGVSVLGLTAYVISSYDLYSIDVSNPRSPRVIGKMAMEPEFITAYDNYLYVTDSVAGLEILDVSNPSSPQIVGSQAVENAEWLAVSDTIACVSTTDGAPMAFVDVANRRRPWVMGYAGESGRFAVSGRKVYVPALRGLDVFDFSSPYTPPIRANLALSGFATDVVVSGSTAYIADWGAGVRMVDVSMPESPRYIGRVATPDSAYAVAAAGKHLYAADYNAGLQVIDISKPTGAHIVGSVSLPGHAYDVEVSGNRAYVAGLDAGLDVVDISNPLAPAFLGRVWLPDYALGVAVSGTTAYVAAQYAGLQVVDCLKPSAPRVIGTLDTPDGAAGIAIEGTTVYLAYAGGFDVVDVSNPAAPQLIGTTWSPGYGGAVVPAGNYAYVADYIGGMQVLDVRHPSEPRTVGGALVTASGLALYRDCLLDVDDSGLHVLATQCDPSVADTVFPGDANDDGVVDARDILPIGQYFGLSGPARQDASIHWGPQVLSTRWPAPDEWAEYADCDGDGTVGAGDVLAVIQNWGARVGQPPPETDRRAVCEELLAELDQMPSAGSTSAIRNVVLDYLRKLPGQPTAFHLEPNQPNPFGAETAWVLTEPTPAPADLAIYDAGGRLVWRTSVPHPPVGASEIHWDGVDLLGRLVPAGSYCYRLTAGSYRANGRAMVIR